MKKDRAERLGNSRHNVSRRSSIRGVSRRSGVVTGALAGKRTSRQASKAARQKISEIVAAMSNLGKKMRRSTMANSTTSFTASNSSNECSALEYHIKFQVPWVLSGSVIQATTAVGFLKLKPMQLLVLAVRHEASTQSVQLYYFKN